MPYKSKQEGGMNKGKPSQRGKDKSEIKEVNEEALDRADELQDKYADEEGNPDPDKVYIAHRNRHPGKTSIDKPSYGGT